MECFNQVLGQDRLDQNAGRSRGLDPKAGRGLVRSGQENDITGMAPADLLGGLNAIDTASQTDIHQDEVRMVPQRHLDSCCSFSSDLKVPETSILQGHPDAEANEIVIVHDQNRGHRWSAWQFGRTGKCYGEVSAVVLVHGYLSAQLINQFGDDLPPDHVRRRGPGHPDAVVRHHKAELGFTYDSQRDINGAGLI
jgi:hypothetical protein